LAGEAPVNFHFPRLASRTQLTKNTGIKFISLYLIARKNDGRSLSIAGLY
jgi:hypothetical protein